MSLRIKRENMYAVRTFDPFTAQDILHGDLSVVACENPPPEGCAGRILVNISKLSRKKFEEMYNTYYTGDPDALSDNEWKDTLYGVCGLVIGFFDYVAGPNGLRIRHAQFTDHCYRADPDGRIVQEEEED